MERIVFVGECMVELSGDPMQRTFGGDTLNTALYLSRLLKSTEIQVQYATSLGDDSLSGELLEQWRQEGIDNSLVSIEKNKMPGLYLVETDQYGERTFHYWRSDSAAKSYFDTISPLEKSLASNTPSLIYFSGISLAILSTEAKRSLLSTVKQASLQGALVVFDNNYRPRLWTEGDERVWYAECLRLADVALITEDDDEAVWGNTDIENRCRDFGCNHLVIKRGEHPCVVIDSLQSGSPDYYRVEGNVVENVVDTCAAGDSFAAGYLAGMLLNQPVVERAKMAHRLASTVIQYPGAIIPTGAMPTFNTAQSEPV